MKTAGRMCFLQEYKKHKKLETAGPEEIAKAEEESWRIKSAYYPELTDRYGLAPQGFLKLPHETGGLKALLKEGHPQSPYGDKYDLEDKEAE